MDFEFGGPEGFDPERFGDAGFAFSGRFGRDLGRNMVVAQGRVFPRIQIERERAEGVQAALPL